MSQTKDHERARARAKAKYWFGVHFVVYAVVMSLLLAINLISSPETLWFVWPLLGWGLAILLHAASVFLGGGEDAIIDAMTARELRKSESKNGDEGP